MVFAISMVKDEADVAPWTITRMASEVDHVIVADNGSTDATRTWLNHRANVWPHLTILDDHDPAYYQSHKMSALAEIAREMGAAWVVPFDADEVWCARGGKTIKQALEGVPEDVRIVEADLYDHVPTARDRGDVGPLGRIVWRRPHPNPLPKVACRALPGLTIEQGNHGARYADQHVPLRLGGLLSVRHFPYRSAAQMVRKARNGAAAYAATDLPEDVGKHWRDYGRLTDEQIGEVFRTYFWSPNPQADGLVYDPV
ncbi:MAG: glycosyltransferase family 2 protein [Solirubrobacteraceae bacterium]